MNSLHPAVIAIIALVPNLKQLFDSSSVKDREVFATELLYEYNDECRLQGESLSPESFVKLRSTDVQTDLASKNALPTQLMHEIYPYYYCFNFLSRL